MRKPEIFEPVMLLEEQQRFVEHFSSRFVQRSLLLGMGGTGKTTTALLAADRLLKRGDIDRIVVVSATRSLTDQWKQMGAETGHPLGDGTTQHQAGAAISLAQVETGEASRWLADESPTRWLLIVDNVEWVNDSLVRFVDQVLARDAGSRALFVGRVAPRELAAAEERFAFGSEFLVGETVAQPETQSRLALLAPSFALLQEIRRDLSKVDELSWREFEKLIAHLLESDGYSVELMRGTKDGGLDVVAIKDLGAAGYFKSVWQAKKNRIDRRIELPVIRELADVRMEHGASKGIIVTTSYLTAGALKRVERDRYLLSKVDRDDLSGWIDRTLSRSA